MIQTVSAQTEPLPSVVFIVIDDLGLADLSFLAQSPPDVHTPHIDALAAQSVEFSQAYTTSPICSPSWMGLLTGRYQQRWGAYWYGQGGLGPDQPTLPKELKKLGYYNIKIGKTHLNEGESENPRKHGFDEYMGFIDHTKSYVFLHREDRKRFGPDNWKYKVGPLLKNDWEFSFAAGNYTTDIFCDQAIQYIHKHQASPFYLQVSFNAMHAPLEQNISKYMEPFGIKDFPVWNPEEESYEDFQEKYGWGKVDKGRLRYLAALKALDEGIGSIMQALDSTGIRDNTIVVLISDNGGSPGTYANNSPFTGHKYIMNEGGIRTPMLFSWPKKWPQNVRREALVSTLDIFPTILEAVGAHPEAPSDGHSLIPLMEEDQETRHHYLVWDSGWEWALRKGPWKLRVTIEEEEFPIFEVPAGTYLYNLEDDPKEENNLVLQAQEKLDELMGVYWHWRNTIAEHPHPQPEDSLDYMQIFRSS
ncbi:MAG: sulfatase-like hydrolase/transferase [Bacteroidota bacterium]